MSGTLEYKGYVATIEYSADDRCFYGKIEFINDLVMFDGMSVDELEAEFRAAVDSYLALCEQSGKEPDLPFKGTFNVRIGEQLHRRAAMKAKCLGLSLNDFVKRAIDDKLGEQPPVQLIHHFHTHIKQSESESGFEWADAGQALGREFTLRPYRKVAH